MKITFVSPGGNSGSLWNVSAFKFPAVTLPTMAGLTPPNVQVAIVDENVDSLDFDVDCDVVAITAMTCFAPRAYQIATEFRKRGIRVIIGGLHASVLPDEALKYADAVVIGEAEAVWAQVVKDLRERSLKKVYRSTTFPDLGGVPPPRRELLRKDGYASINTIQATRGCPHKCEFCSVTRFFGRTYRFRPVSEVLREVETLCKGFIFFVDDNIVGHRNYAKELFRGLAPLNVKWVGQFTVNLADDEELLRLCAKSGCMGAFIGFESLSSSAIRGAHKPINRPKRYASQIRRIHDAGIGIEGAFIFGFDEDDTSVFERTLEFAVETRIDAAQFTVLTPFPGTTLFGRLNQENRIIERNWARYDAAHAVFLPKHMTPEQLEEGFDWSYQQYYSYVSIAKRLFSSRRHLSFFAPFNWGFRRLAAKLPKMRPFKNEDPASEVEATPRSGG